MRTTSSREAYRNPWIRVREDEVEHEDDSTGLYGVVERPDFALVIAADRTGSGWSSGTAIRWTAGRGSSRRAPGARAAQERLRNWRAPSWRRRPASGRARCAGPTAREATEADMRSAFVTEAELRAMIGDGRFTDSPSLVAYSLLLLA